jgi:hypothetical protein
MDHGSDFQNLWKQLRNEVRALQNRGYYGDGMHASTWEMFEHLDSISKVTGQRGPNSLIRQKFLAKAFKLANFRSIWCVIKLFLYE